MKGTDVQLWRKIVTECRTDKRWGIIFKTRKKRKIGEKKREREEGLRW